MTQAKNPRIPARSIALEKGRLAPAVLLGVLILSLSILGVSPARADYEPAIYCDGHGGAYGAAHYRNHDDGYILSASGRYSFYPSSAYATLAANYYGASSVYVSGGFFYPLQIGYGPVYEPSGYFSIHAGRFGRTSLGLQIGIGFLPTIGIGYLAYEPHVVQYTVPRWHYRGDYVRRHAAPHAHYVNRHRAAPGHHAKPHRAHVAQRHEKRYKWQKAVHQEMKHQARIHDRGHRKHDTPERSRRKHRRND